MALTAALRRARAPMLAALAVAGGAALALGGAWAIQLAGTPPCELCLLQRDPYYAGLPLALLTAALAGRYPRLGGAGLLALAALFLGSAGLGIYHAGVEWHVWAGPSGCTGPLTAPAAIDDFLKDLKTVRVVRCDAAALRVLGLSLAGWNALVSLGLSALALLGWRAAQAGSAATRSPGRTVPPSTTLA